ncbi:MAG TPA: hypothetical protein VJ951_00965 [Bacteroidales bacterium]|nr:hypothetical protein [Bacteroidales bacterium]
MELTDVIHATDQDLNSFKADIFIAATGYEKRSTRIPELYTNSDAEKIVISSLEYKNDLSRKENDLYFKKCGFRFVNASMLKAPDFKLILGEQINDGVKILIDITSMPGIWYHSFFNYVLQQRLSKHIEIRATYVPSAFQPPSRPGKKIQLKESPKIIDQNIRKKKDKNTALIMGLGSEKSICNKIYEIIQPDLTHLLYADPATDVKYVEKVLVNNHTVISKTPIRNLNSYPLYNSKMIYDFLIDLIMPLRLDMQVIIVPMGPKIFTLMAVLIQLSYPDIEVHYPQYKLKPLRDRNGTGYPMMVDLLFSVY